MIVLAPKHCVLVPEIQEEAGNTASSLSVMALFSDKSRECSKIATKELKQEFLYTHGGYSSLLTINSIIKSIKL